MSTISLAAGPIRPTSTRLRITARGRRVLVGLAAVPAAAAVGVAVLSGGLLSGGDAVAADGPGAPAGTYETVTVMPGDSLWSIAELVAPDDDPRDVVAALMNLNAIPSGGLDAGQSVAIPLEYSRP